MSGKTTGSSAEREGFRAFAEASPEVRAFYRDNHTRQTLAFVRAKREEYLPPCRERMGVWDAFDRLSEIIDASDPDIALTQRDHALQTAEALRESGAPRWLVLTGLVHDLGKLLCLQGEPQWAVVGDTFPVGCAFAPEVVYSELFSDNPDVRVAEYANANGIYAEGCGLDALTMSWGHDEYLYHVLASYLPEPAGWIIRYHSFYAAHRERAYAHLLCDADAPKLSWLRHFSAYDLYSKRDDPPRFEAVRGYYEALVAELLPGELDW